MAEALSAGTPVLAFPRGAAPEIIEHGITGWLGRDEEELASVLRNSREFDRAACRASVERRFSVPRMARDHERLYERLVKRAARPGSAATAAAVAASRTPIAPVGPVGVVAGATARSTTHPPARLRRSALAQANVENLRHDLLGRPSRT